MIMTIIIIRIIITIIIPVTNPNSKVEPLNLEHTSVDPKGYDERCPTAEAYS